MGLLGACVEGLMPLAYLVGNVIAPSEKTSPRPSDNGSNPFYPEIKPMMWATACQRVPSLSHEKMVAFVVKIVFGNEIERLFCLLKIFVKRPENL